MNNSPLILAVDTDDLTVAKRWIKESEQYVGTFKLGLEFFLKFGAMGVHEIKAITDRDIFLDLKLHDIPNTVTKAAHAVSDLKPKFLTVHASGGAAMINGAVKALPNTDITAVTILTSLDDNDLREIGFIGDSASRAVELAKLAVKAGARAIVCSPQEIAAIRAVISNEIAIITPGVRPIQNSNPAKMDDQKRVMDPKSAIQAGANYLVIGRPITEAADIGQAAKSIFEEITR